MNILITGVTGFIGGHLCQRLIDERQDMIVACVRPQTKIARYERFRSAAQIVEMDLSDAAAVNRLFAAHHFDCVLYLAAVRGGGAASNAEFERSNILAPVTLAHAAMQQNSRFLFCSSVGVFGAIPQHLPPTEETPRCGDNDYHASKIEAENRLRALQAQGLRLTILRPIITYGVGDTGFPAQLIRLIERGFLWLPRRDIRIHLVDVQTLVEAFLRAMRQPDAIGKTYTVTDKSPVSLHALANFIAQQIHGKPYPAWKIVPMSCFRLAEFGFELLHADAWTTRVQLMSRDWYYDGTLAERDLHLELKETLPNIRYIISEIEH